MTTAVASKVSEAENDKLLGRGPSIQTFGATAFNDLLAGEKVLAAFALQVGECAGLLRAAWEDISLDQPGNRTQALDVTSREQRLGLRPKSAS